MSERIPVNVSKELYEKIAKRVKEAHGEFSNADQYVESVLNRAAEEQASTQVSHLRKKNR